MDLQNEAFSPSLAAHARGATAAGSALAQRLFADSGPPAAFRGFLNGYYPSRAKNVSSCVLEIVSALLKAFCSSL